MENKELEKRGNIDKYVAFETLVSATKKLAESREECLNCMSHCFGYQYPDCSDCPTKQAVDETMKTVGIVEKKWFCKKEKKNDLFRN